MRFQFSLATPLVCVTALAIVGRAQNVVNQQNRPATGLSGVVVDPEGKPISGAVLSPRGYTSRDYREMGPMEKVALSVVANDRGEFKIDTLIPVDSLDVVVRAKGFTPYLFQQVAVGRRQTLALERGVTIVGRVVRDGKPLAGVAMVVTWTERRSDGFSGPWEAVTDEDGHFEIPNVTAHRAIFLYGRMSSLTGRGALPRESFTTGDNGSTLDVAAIKGDLNVERGFTVFGRVILSDGKPVPKGSRVNLVRAGCADNQTVEIGGNGEFVICDVPRDECSLNVLGPPTDVMLLYNDYHLSDLNDSLQPQRRSELIGQVIGDTTLTILSEPGRTLPRPMPDTIEEVKELRARLDEPRSQPLRAWAE